jgi:hypothetical protein
MILKKAAPVWGQPFCFFILWESFLAQRKQSCREFTTRGLPWGKLSACVDGSVYTFAS